jgi:hypothetical protein
MGTPHIIKIVDKTGRIRINQYGQWDGYPSGQGQDILNFLSTHDLDLFEMNVSNIHKIKKKECEMVECDTFGSINYPYLSRDCGSEILQMIYDNKVKFVKFATKEAKSFCFGFYTINFKTNEFKSKFKKKIVTYHLDALPTPDEYLKAFKIN